ncbi:MAG: O-antigen ligase family protein [Bacteroidetes bacterium]|nr:O-antigen ligase family protein [Bacteroidota bacterium]
MIRSSQKNFFSYSYLFGIFLLAASLPWSNLLMSISEIILLFSWLLEGNLKEKIKLFTKNKTAVVISSVFVLHLIGLTYTSDFSYGLEDIRKKIPLLLLPLIFSSSPPLRKEIFEKILYLFSFSVIAASLACFYVLLGFTRKQILQPYEASVFISHIRFGLLISLTLFILGYFFITKKSSVLKVAVPLLIIWLLLFLIMMESATGLICTAIVSVVLIIRLFLHTRKVSLKIVLLSIILLGGIVATKTFSSLSYELNNKPIGDKKSLPLLTKNGNPYAQDTAILETENGNYVWLNVCEKELSEEWNKKSKLDYNGKDLRGNEIKYTLIRFLTSKGLTKDAEGISALSEKEVKAIEKGIPNINFMSLFNPTARIQKIVWEFNNYSKGGNPSGHSVTQRLEYWKTAVGIIRENLLLGVGTGDVEKAFDTQYEKTNSPLTKKWRLRSHNQFLSIGAAFGIIGMFWFLFTLFYPMFAERKLSDYLYMIFFIIAFLSMFTEDTLETQAGVTFFAFFNSFYLFCREKSVTDSGDIVSNT